MGAIDYINSLFNLEGHVGIITGASRGIGLATAKVLCNSGAKIYNFSRTPHPKSDFDLNGNFIDIEVDLLNKNSVKNAVQEISKIHKNIDFFINNAGFSFKERAEIFPYEKYLQIQRIDLEAVFELCQLCFPLLKNSPNIGRIVSITSMGSYMGFCGVTPYCMMKSGLLGLTRGLAEEWKNDNILVNSVAPGWVLTKINEKMFEKNPNRKEAALNKPI